MKYPKFLKHQRIVNMAVTMLFAVIKWVAQFIHFIDTAVGKSLNKVVRKLQKRLSQTFKSKIVIAFATVSALFLGYMTFIDTPQDASAYAACSPSSSSSGGYVTLTFTNTSYCTWTTPSGVVSFDLLVVGAGGGGGSDAGGGGGGGSYYLNTVNVGSTVSPLFDLVVGSGGRQAIHTYDSNIGLSAGAASAGSASAFYNIGGTLGIVANGGNAGGSSSDVAAGGSGTGGSNSVTNSSSFTLGSATSGSGGTGGAGIAFGNTCGSSSGVAGRGGSGGISNISVFGGSFSGGGGGGACLNGAYDAISSSRLGGAGINGSGNGSGGYNGSYVRFHATNASANTGAGGGGGASHGSTGYYTDPNGKSGFTRNASAGANGVVKIRYQSAPTAPSVSTSPSNVFTASGTSPSFSVAATNPGGGTVKIQWQVSSNSGSSWSDIGSLITGTSNTYSVGSVTTTQNGYQYRAVVRNYSSGGNYSETISSAASLRVTASTLSSISFSPSTVTNGSSTSYLVNGSPTVQQTFYGCYSDRTTATKTPQVGAGTWTGLSVFSRTNSGTTPETFIREMWYNRDVNGNAVNSVPSAADCTRIAGAYSPDISATLVTNPTASVSSTSAAYTPRVGAGFSTTLTSSGIGSSITYSVTPALPAGLTLSSSTGVIDGTPTTAQTATSYTVTATGSSYGTGTRTFTIEVLRGTQTVSITSTAPASPLPNGTYTPTATSSIGQSVSFSVSSSNGNVCSISGGVVTFQESGDCVVTATQAGTSNYESASTSQTITVGRLSQTLTFGTVNNKSFGDADFAVSATTTAGSLPITFASTDSGKCTVSGSTIHIVEAGNCVVTATQAGNAVYLPATQTLTISVAKASQATVSVTNGSSVVYGSTLPLTASGGSGTASGYTFTRVSGPCSISGTTLSTTAAGNCVFYATKAGDANYNTSANSANFTVSITPKPLTLSVTVSPSSRAYDTTRDISLATTTSANLTGLINSDVVTVDNTKLSATIDSADVGTNKTVTVTVATGYLTGTHAANYLLPSVSGSPTVSITQANQSAITFTSALTTIFGQNITLSATGGSGTGALTFATSSGACQIASSIMTPVSAGTCVVVATRAADTNYTAQSASQSVSIGYADQSVVTMTSATTVVYGSTLTLGAQGGSGTGVYEFEKVSGNCTLSTAVITPTAVGDCIVKARRAGDTAYNVSSWSADVTISITPKQLTIQVTPFPSSRAFNGSRSVSLATLSSSDISGLVGSDSITLDNSKISATVADSAVGQNKPVTTVISAGFLGGTHAANYQEPTVSNSPTLTIAQATQSTVTISSATTFVYGSTHTLTATGGTGSGAYEYQVTSGNCSISGDSLTASSVGDCLIQARRAADISYSVSAWSVDQTVTVTPKPLSLSVEVSPSARAYDATRVVALADTTSANLTGIINSDVVTVDNSKISATVASAIVGDNKTVTVSVASGYLTGTHAANYLLPTIIGTPSVNIVKANQSAVTMTSETTVEYGSTLTLSATGGESLMGYEFEVVSGPCVISSASLTTTAAGTCAVRARHLGDTNYNTSAWSSNVSISVTAKPITLSVTVSPTSRAYDTTRTVALASTSASNLTGIINGDIVTTDDTKLTATISAADVGTNKAVTVAIATGYLTGTNAGNYSVSSVTGTPLLTITQASQGALSWVSALSTVYGQNLSLSATGGSGTGALSYATTSGPCTVASSIVTPTSVGTCVVVVTRAADTNYTVQMLSGNVAIGQAAQSTVTATSATTVVYGSTLTLTASGGDGGGAYEFSRISGDCDVTGNVLTPLAVGDCEFHVRKLSSTNYLTSAWSSNVTVSVTPKPLTVTVAPVTRQYDGSRTIALATTTAADLNGVEANDVLTVDHSQLSATVATAAVGSNKAVTVTVGSSYLSGADMANYQLPTVAGSPVVDITRANQAAVSFTSATSTTYGIDLTLSVSGGSGTGAVSYAVNSGPCSVIATTLTPTASGTCVVTATKAQDTTYLAETVTYNVTVAAADQAPVSVNNASTVVYGSALTLSASGGTGSGAVEFAQVSGPCSVSGTTLSNSAVGTCVVQARKLGDSRYNVSAWSSNFSITVTPKPLSLSVTVSPASRPYNTSTQVALASTSASNLTGVINNDSVGTDDSKLTASISTADVATNKAVTVAVASGYLTGAHAGNYSLPTVTDTPVLTVTQTSQASLAWTSVLSTVYGQNITLSATGGSGTGALSFATTSGPCTVASSIVTPTSVGTCVVVVTRAADTNYTAQTLTGNVEIGQATQTTVSMTNVTTVVYGSTLTLTATGGEGSGAYDFAKVNGLCAVSGDELTPLGVGDCVVHARKLSSTNFATSAWSADLTISMTAKPLTLTVSPQNRQWNGSTSIALAPTTASNLSGIEAGDTVSVDDSFLSASVSTADVGANKPVTVSISAGYLSGIDAANYLLPTISGSPNVTISRADQAALSFTSGTSTTYGQTLALTSSGGTGTGETSYAVDSGPCLVSGSTLTSTAAGSCVVTATKAQDANYSATTANYTVSVAYADQSLVSITNSNTVVYGSTLSLTASGGTGTGSFAFSPVSGPCSISGSTLSTTAAGDCVFKARKLGDSGYNASSWTSNFTVSITPKPLTLSVTVDPSSRQYNTTRNVALAPTSSANLTGIINSDAVGTDDSKLTALVSTADVATNKVVAVTVAQGFLTGANAANYQLPTVTGTPVLSITRTAQSEITVTSALTTIFGQNISLSATGGSGTGALTFATTSGPCTVAASIMTPTSAGSCVVVATRAGDNNYFAQTQSSTVDIAAAAQSAVTMTSATTVVYGSTLNLTATGGTGSGAYSFAKVSGACDVTGATLTPLSVGECVVHARKAADASYAVSNWSADVTITLTAKPLTLSVTPSPGLRPFNGSSVVALATTTAADLVGLEAGDDVSVDHSKLVATVATPAVGSNKPVTVVVQSGYLVGPESGNYFLPTITGSPLLTITQTNQSGISFANASSVPYGQNLTLVASGGSGTGTLTVTQTSGPCTVTNNVMTSTGVGTCAVTATRASDATYLAESTTASISITRAAQTLNFTSAVPEEPMPGDTYTPVAVSSGGAAVTLNITNGLATVCTLTNGVVSFLAAGQCVITASQAGTSNYLAATSISQTIVAGMLNQTITFPIITDRDFGSAAFSASATVNSGLNLGYSSTTGSICSVNSSGLITPLAVGTCSITISQAAGNEVYAPASPVTRTFRVLAIVPTAPQVTSVSSGDSSITVAFTPPASRGGVPITNYVLTATPTSGPAVVKSDCAAVPVSTPPACTISGLTNGVDYTLAVAATNSAGTGPSSNSSPSIAPATAPDSVTSLAAIPGNTTLTATWRPPTNFGGGTFSRYELTLTPRDGTALPTVMLYSSAANRYAFTGLTNGVAYDLEILVISTANTADMGSNRATAIGIPATESTAPRNVSAQATSSTTALVSWEVPLSNGGSPITGYSVSPAGCVFATPTATRCEYRNLTPRSSFAITVVATNVMGGSVATETSVTLPDTPAPPVVATRAATPVPVAENIVTPAVLSAIPEFQNAPYPGMQFDAPKTGNVVALVDGNKVDAWMSVTGQTVTVQTEQGVKVSVQNSEFSTTSGDSLVLNPGSTVQVEADGYTPGSPLEAWIFSTPVRLGDGVADGDGSFQGEFPLSSSAQLGQHTVVVHGLSTNGEVITVAIGVRVVDIESAPEAEGPQNGTFMGFLIIGLLLAVALVLLVIRRRNKREEA